MQTVGDEGRTRIDRAVGTDPYGPRHGDLRNFYAILCIHVWLSTEGSPSPYEERG